SGQMGGWPTFRFLKGGIPRAYPACDLWILRMLARSCISVGTGEDEKEARRCMSPRLPPLQEIEAQKCRHPPRDACLKPIRSQGITDSPAVLRNMTRLTMRAWRRCIAKWC